MAGLRDTPDVREWTYAFYLTRPDAMAAPSVVATFGCFAYARPPGERIRLHFQNAGDGWAAPRWPSTASGSDGPSWPPSSRM